MIKIVSKFEFSDFLLLKQPRYDLMSKSPDRDVLEEFVKYGLFTVTTQEKRPDGCILFECTSSGEIFYRELLTKFESLFNEKLEATLSKASQKFLYDKNKQ